MSKISPRFLRISDVAGVPDKIATVLTLDHADEEAWLVVNVGSKFIIGAVVGDYVELSAPHMGVGHVVIRLGKEWSAPSITHKRVKDDEKEISKLREFWSSKNSAT